jgi:hypothetical protein
MRRRRMQAQFAFAIRAISRSKNRPMDRTPISVRPNSRREGTGTGAAGAQPVGRFVGSPVFKTIWGNGMLKDLDEKQLIFWIVGGVLTGLALEQTLFGIVAGATIGLLVARRKRDAE